MGIRLYPNTQNTAALEKLAGVPAGTAAKLAEIEARHNVDGATTHADYQDRYEAFQNELSANADADRYHGFLLFGWGKFNDPFRLAPDDAGSLADAGAVRVLFTVNGIDADPELCEGVHWS